MRGYIVFLLIVISSSIVSKGRMDVLPTEAYVETPSRKYNAKKVAGKAVLPEMILVRGGVFYMGNYWGDDDEKPTHRVKVSSFYMGKYEITQAQWKAVMGNNPSNTKDCDNCPVEQVSWYDIQDFIQKLNAQSGLTYRLPTEAEWEYAARGGRKGTGYEYAGSNNIEEVAWYFDNANETTHPVGTKQPNELGLYDMNGNVSEWCNDLYSPYYYKFSSYKNPQGADSGSNRVVRGGGWFSYANGCRVSYRYGNNPSGRFVSYGFRLVITL